MDKIDKTDASLTVLMALEHHVWQALVTGDRAADRAALATDFVGVYPSGLSDRAGHVAQLDHGPSVSEYAISQAKAQIYAPDLAMLIYRAEYRRTGGKPLEAMYVSSLWQRRAGKWQNVFSQDSPATI